MIKKILLTITAAFLLAAPTLHSAENKASDKNTSSKLTQISTLQALLESCYEGIITAGELKKLGTYGIGTFNDLDGEMIMYNGEIYKARATGEVVKVEDSQTIPFANVSLIGQEQIAAGTEISGSCGSFSDLKNAILKNIKNYNVPHCVIINFNSAKIRVRSVPAQKRPYPRLVEVVKNQKVFENDKINGVLIGFYFPKYFQGINATGFHLHFLSTDKNFGGHLLEISGSYNVAALLPQYEFNMLLPKEGDFAKARLYDKAHEKEINRVEK